MSLQFGERQRFLHGTHKNQKEMDEVAFIKVRNFASLKDAQRKKGQAAESEITSTVPLSEQRFAHRIYF